jgi:hypothetical protein
VLLNGKTANIPLQLTTNSDTSLSFNGVMNLENWDAIAAKTVSVQHGVKYRKHHGERKHSS